MYRDGTSRATGSPEAPELSGRLSVAGLRVEGAGPLAGLAAGLFSSARAAELPALLAERIVIIDGAMGTMIQRHRLTEEQFRGERFAASAQHAASPLAGRVHHRRACHEGLDRLGDVIRVEWPEARPAEAQPEVGRQPVLLRPQGVDRLLQAERAVGADHRVRDVGPAQTAQ